MIVDGADPLDPARVGEVERLDVPCEVTAITVLRRRFASALMDDAPAGLSPGTARFVHDAVMVLSELAMNALIHGTPDEDGFIQVAWWRTSDAAVTVQVRDQGGQSVPHLEQAEEDAAGGRGLALVAALSREWGVVTDIRGGTVVSATIAAS